MTEPLKFWQHSRPGMSPFGILIILILIIFLFFMMDMGFIYGSQACIGMDPFDCALEMLTSDEEEEKPAEGSVTATGEISKEVKGSTRSVSISISFPLEGGAVTGSFSGDCDGTIKGTYAGGNGGSISGTGKGSCAFIFPASGNFSGTVNQSNKTVPVHGQGSAAGISGEGSLTLSY
jgi:hypothetical protein